MKQDTVLAEVDGGLGTTLQAGHPQVAWAASKSGDTAVSSSSLSATAARLPVSALAAALGTAQSQPSAAPPAATSWDADARQSILPATAACLRTNGHHGRVLLLQLWLHRRQSPIVMLCA
jgi:hypothetical protein